MENLISFASGGKAFMNHKFFKVSSADLLLASTSNVETKDVVTGFLSTEQKSARATSYELLKNSLLPLDNPLVTVSVRNVLSNLRCLAYKKGLSFVTVQGEDLNSGRSHFCLGYTDDHKFEMKEIQFKGNDSVLTGFQWLITGIPVIWEGLKGADLFDAILTEAADHSHVYYLPRGKHPEATGLSKNTWNAMHDVFIKSHALSRKELSDKLKKIARKSNLIREKNYLHNVLGTDPQGNLVQMADKDTLENIGKRMAKEYGVKNAICVDNGGSVEVGYYPDGLGKPGYIKCEFGHRFEGTAYLGLSLETKCIKT